MDVGIDGQHRHPARVLARGGGHCVIGEVGEIGEVVDGAGVSEFERSCGGRDAVFVGGRGADPGRGRGVAHQVE